MEKFKFLLLMCLSISTTSSQESTDFTEAYVTEKAEEETTLKTISELAQEQTELIKKIVSETTEQIQNQAENIHTDDNNSQAELNQQDDKKILSQVEHFDEPEIKKILSQMSGGAQNLNDSAIAEMISQMGNTESRPGFLSEKEKQFIEELRLKCKFFGLIGTTEKTTTPSYDSQNTQNVNLNRYQVKNKIPQQSQPIRGNFLNAHFIQQRFKTNESKLVQENPTRNQNLYVRPLNQLQFIHKKDKITQQQANLMQSFQDNILKKQQAQSAQHFPSENFNQNRPYFVQQNPPGNNYFYWYPQTPFRINKLADDNLESSGTENQNTEITPSPNYQQQSDEIGADFMKMNLSSSDKLKYVRLEPLILQKTSLTNGQTLLHWYRLMAGAQSFIQIPDIPEHEDVHAIAQPHTQPQQTLPLPEEYLYYVDPHTGAIIKNLKIHEATTKPPVETTEAGIKGKIQYFVNPQNGLIYQPYVIALNQKNQHDNFIQFQEDQKNNLNQDYYNKYLNQIQDQHLHQIHQDQHLNQIHQNQHLHQIQHGGDLYLSNNHQGHTDEISDSKNKISHGSFNKNQQLNINYDQQGHQQNNQGSLDKNHQINTNYDQQSHQQNNLSKNQHQNTNGVQQAHQQYNKYGAILTQLTPQYFGSQKITYGFWPHVVQPYTPTPLPVTTTETPTTEKVVTTTTTTTTEAPKKSIQYTIDYSQYDNFQDKYKNQYRFVLPMIVGGNNQDLTQLPIDPYAYLPKEKRPDFLKISVPYVPNYHMIKAIAVPKKQEKEKQDDLDNVDLK